MTKHLQTLALVFAFALASTAMVRTQEKEKPAAPPAKAVAITPLKVQVVISRYQGDKKISSMPYNLSINAMAETGAGPISRANIRMGSKMPVMMMAAPVVDGKAMPAAGPLQYQDVGTNIDCAASVLSDGRFRVDITVDDTSVYPDDPGASPTTKGTPSFRSFRASDATTWSRAASIPNSRIEVTGLVSPHGTMYWK